MIFTARFFVQVDRVSGKDPERGAFLKRAGIGRFTSIVDENERILFKETQSGT
jgi:hypothetical protein